MSESHCVWYKILIIMFLNLYHFLKSSHLSVWRHTDGGPSHDCWLTGAFQHRLHWCLTSDPPRVSCHQLFHRRSRYRQEWLLRLMCFVVGCNNEHRSSHLLPSSERLKRINVTFGFEGNAPLIYLNVSMFARIIRDPASSTEEVSTRFFKWIFVTRPPNNVLISQFHDECG